MTTRNGGSASRAFRPNAVAEFEGGRRVARLPGEEQPHVWIGTIVLGAEQIIYLGNGEWQPLADAPNHPNSSVGERSGMFPDGVRLVRLLVG